MQLATDNLIDHYHQERLNECQQLMEDGSSINANQYIISLQEYYSSLGPDSQFLDILNYNLATAHYYDFLSSNEFLYQPKMKIIMF